MPEQYVKNKILPFDDFLDYLRCQGFIIGVDHYLRLHTLLNKLSPDCQPSDLKYLICTIFAINEKQQKKFYDHFDFYFKLLNIDTHKKTSKPFEIEQSIEAAYKYDKDRKESIFSKEKTEHSKRYFIAEKYRERIKTLKLTYILLGIILILLIINFPDLYKRSSLEKLQSGSG